MYKFFGMVLLYLVCGAAFASGTTSVRVIKSKFHSLPSQYQKIEADLRTHVNVDLYREVKAQVIYSSEGQPDHLLIFLFKKGFHSVKFAKAQLDSQFNFISDVQDYKIQLQDEQQQEGDGTAAVCPDPTVQFIAFAPNQNDLEQQVTIEVAKAAETAGLKTVRLLLADATRQNYLNYMSCPNLVGNFYDGDANPESMVTVDGMINATDFSSILKGAMRFRVTNIWLACEAYNDPMLSAVTIDAQAQKYAAGINDLQIGPSDQAAACAMEAAIQGKPMTAAFQDCYSRLDVNTDQWGFGGKGADLFNTEISN